MTRDDRREPTNPGDITRRTWLGGAVATTGAAELRKVYGA